MAKATYSIDDFLSDAKFVDRVESSDASHKIDSDFDNGYITDVKRSLLKLKGYRGLNVKGGRRPLRECSNVRVSRALRNCYRQAKKKVVDYQKERQRQTSTYLQIKP